MTIPKKRIITPQIITTASGWLLRRLIIVAVLLAVWTWAVYQFGRDGLDSGVTDPTDQVVDSGPELKLLKAKYDALKSQAAEIGKTGQEMSDARNIAEEKIKRLQDEQMALTKQASALTKQVSALTESAAANKLHLNIKGLEVNQGSEPGSFEYRVVIEPLQGVSRTVNGMLKLAVTGDTDGTPAVINMSEDDGIQEDNRRIFGLHQYLKGTLKFPDLFLPKTVKLELFTGDDTTNPLAHDFKWTDVLTEQQPQQEGIDQNEKIISDLRRENLAMVIKMAKHERSVERAKLSAASGGDATKFEQEKTAMLEEIEQLKQKLDNLSGKLKIKTVSLKQKKNSREVEIGVTVTRTIIDGQRLNGMLTFALAGQEDGQDKMYLLEQLTSDQKSNYKLGFKNYQAIKEPVLLPKGFTPQKIMIHVESDNIEIDELNEELDWQQLVGDTSE